MREDRIKPMTVEQKRDPKEIEDSLDFSFRELCKGPLIMWCVVLASVLGLVFTGLSMALLYYFCFLIAFYLLGSFIRTSDARFREKCSRLGHWEKNWLVDKSFNKILTVLQVERNPERFYLARRWFETVGNMSGWRIRLASTGFVSRDPLGWRCRAVGNLS